MQLLVINMNSSKETAKGSLIGLTNLICTQVCKSYSCSAAIHNTIHYQMGSPRWAEGECLTSAEKLAMSIATITTTNFNTCCVFSFVIEGEGHSTFRLPGHQKMNDVSAFVLMNKTNLTEIVNFLYVCNR